MLFLASRSPRRHELLTQINQKFEQVSADIVELKQYHESAKQFVIRMASEKAQSGFTNLSSVNNNDLVLGSDTIVVCQNQVLGKPANFADAKQMLQLLSAQEHEVMTAIAIKTNKELLFDVVTTKVLFRSISEHEIVQYWQSGEPLDKAGSYAIQGLAGKFVKRIEGSYSSVVGLPLYETEQLLIMANRTIEKGA